MIELMIVGTQRAEILEKTLRSFKKNLFRNAPVRVIVNIDPVGPDRTATHCLDVIQEHWHIEAVRVPGTPHFPTAFKWVWERVRGEIAFYLEDDWELLRPVSLTDMIEVMMEVRDLATLRLPFKPTQRDSMKNWKFHFPWVDVGDSGYFQCPKRNNMEVGFCGHPSLIRGLFVKRCAPLIDVKWNPEKQFHAANEALMKESNKWKYGVYARQQDTTAIRDIGRQWMVENGYRKAGSKAWFENWERVKEEIG